jgi:hypothetical protein
MSEISDKTVRSDIGDDTILGSSCSIMSFISMGEVKVAFRNSDWREPASERGKFRRVELDVGDWIEMGKPDTITVTVEPGDRLNDPVHQ